MSAWARRAHAGAKLAAVTALLLAATLAPPAGLLPAAVAVALVLLASRAATAAKGALLALPFALVLAVTLGFTRRVGAGVPVGPLTFHADAFMEGALAGARLAVALAASLWFATTTPPRDALGLLRRFPRLALAAATVARLVPALAADYRAVREARALRGALPAGRFRRILASGALFPPLFVRAARRGLAAEEALRAAGYDPTARREAYGRRAWAARDWGLALGAAAIAGVAAAAGWVWG